MTTDPARIDQLHTAAEQARAELRADVAPAAADYALALDQAADAGRRWAQDPDRDDLEQAALDQAAELARATDELRKALKAARGAFTRRVRRAGR